MGVTISNVPIMSIVPIKPKREHFSGGIQTCFGDLDMRKFW
jgi:hypothetical protein